ncbi:hypothetical protein BGW42_003224 [Actinomortierella wolfii]|nr:hypothetical protein BGW42_003224 [Actinomortierella wolfii]
MDDAKEESQQEVCNLTSTTLSFDGVPADDSPMEVSTSISPSMVYNQSNSQADYGEQFFEAIGGRQLDRVMQLLSKPTTLGEGHSPSTAACILEYLSTSEYDLPGTDTMGRLGCTRAKLYPLHYALILLASAPLEERRVRYDISAVLVKVSTAQQLDSLVVECDNSAIHVAANYSLSSIAQLMIDRGASAVLVNSLGHRPIDLAREPVTEAVLMRPSAHTVSTRPLSPTSRGSAFQLRFTKPTNLTMGQRQTLHMSTTTNNSRPNNWPAQTTRSPIMRMNTGKTKEEEEERKAYWAVTQSNDRRSNSQNHSQCHDSDSTSGSGDAIIIPNIEHQELQPGRGTTERSSEDLLSGVALSPTNPTGPEQFLNSEERPVKVVLKSILKRRQSRPISPPLSATESDQQQLTSFPTPKKSVRWNEIARIRVFFDVDQEDDSDNYYGYSNGDNHRMMHSEAENASGFGSEFGCGCMNPQCQGYHVSDAGGDIEQDQVVPDSPIDGALVPTLPPLSDETNPLISNPRYQPETQSPPLAFACEHTTEGSNIAETNQHSEDTTREESGESMSIESSTASTPLTIYHPQPTTAPKGRGLRVDTSGVVARPASPLSFFLSPPISPPPPGHGPVVSSCTSKPSSPQQLHTPSSPSSISPLQPSTTSFSDLYYGQETISKEQPPHLLSSAPTSPLPPVPPLQPIRTMSPFRHKDRELKSLSLNALSDDDLKAIGRVSAAGYIHRLNEDAGGSGGTSAGSGAGSAGGHEGAPCPPSKDRVLMGMQLKRSSELSKALPALPSSDSALSESTTSPFDNLTALNSAMNRGLPRLAGQVAGRGYARLSPKQRPPRRGSLTITDLPPPKPLLLRKKGPPPTQGASSPGLNAVSELHVPALTEEPEEEEGENGETKQGENLVEEPCALVPSESSNALPVYSGKMFIRVLGFKVLNLPATSEPVYVYVSLQNNSENSVSSPAVKLSKKTRMGHEFCIPVRPSQELSLSIHVRPDDHVVQSLSADMAMQVGRQDGSRLSKVLSKSRSFMALSNHSSTPLSSTLPTSTTTDGVGRATPSPTPPAQSRLLSLSTRKSFLPTLSSRHQPSRSTTTSTASAVSAPTPNAAPPRPSTPTTTTTTATATAATNAHPNHHSRSHSVDDGMIPMMMFSKFISRADYSLARSGTIHFDKIRKRLGEGNPVHWSFEMLNDWHSTVLHEPTSRPGSVDLSNGGSGTRRSIGDKTSSVSSASILVGVLELQLCFLPGISVDDAPKTLEDVETDLSVRRWKRHLWKEGHLSYLSRRGKGWRRDFYRMIGDALIQHDESLRVLRAMDLSKAVDVKVSSPVDSAVQPSQALSTSTSTAPDSSSSSQGPTVTEGQLLSPPQSPTPLSPAATLPSLMSATIPVITVPGSFVPTVASQPSATAATSTSANDMNKRQFVIEFSGGERICLAADSEHERGQWIQAIRCVLDRVPLATTHHYSP